MDYEIKDIPGYEEKYQATSSGEVFSLLTNKFLKFGDDTYGYDTCTLQGRTFKVHKLMGMTFLENPNSYTQIDHVNRNRKDNRVENLRYVSNSENQNNKNSYAKKSPEMRHIQVKKTTFKVIKKYGDKPPVYKSFKTLAEAQTFRDTLIQKRPAQPVAL
jgi:hypothetical protein